MCLFYSYDECCKETILKLIYLTKCVTILSELKIAILEILRCDWLNA